MNGWKPIGGANNPGDVVFQRRPPTHDSNRTPRTRSKSVGVHPWVNCTMTPSTVMNSVPEGSTWYTLFVAMACRTAAVHVSGARLVMRSWKFFSPLCSLIEHVNRMIFLDRFLPHFFLSFLAPALNDKK